MVRRIVNVALFLAGWFACVLGAAAGHPFAGPAVGAFLLAVHLITTSDPARQVRFVAITGAIGSLIDTLHGAFAIVAFNGRIGSSDLVPLWVTAVWIIFGTTFSSSLRWLSGRYGLAGLFGAIVGPLAYVAGTQLGALSFRGDPIRSVAILAVVWLFVMPGLVWLAEFNGRLDPKR
jgi:hypothetical protein